MIEITRPYMVAICGSAATSDGTCLLQTSDVGLVVKCGNIDHLIQYGPKDMPWMHVLINGTTVFLPPFLSGDERDKYRVIS